MDYILELKNVNKKYPTFELKNVSFSLERGKIMGFIGRNGAGKSTTLKAILNLLTFTGSVKVNGQEFKDNEIENKQNIAFILGGINVYRFVTVKTLKDVTKRFYKDWDEEVFKKYLKLFNISEIKKIRDLSQGMKVKINLAIALSHKAKLLILDEPTSGLDPVSRDEILDIFINLVNDEGVSILFSTQIVSDLERCADYITYIRNGEIIDSSTLNDFVDKYYLIKGEASTLKEQEKNLLIGYKVVQSKFEGLVKKEDGKVFERYVRSTPSIEEVMIFLERSAK
jgi:ABC-2 type transport system ATP-binding protein